MARCFGACVLLFALLDGASALQQGDFLAVHLDGPNKHSKVNEDEPVDLPKTTKAHHGKLPKGPEASPEALAKVAQPTGRPDKNETAAEATGVAANAAGDLDAFIAALITNIVTIIIMFCLGSFLRRKFPLVYSKNTFTLKKYMIDEGELEQAEYDDADPEVKKVLDQPWEDKIGGCLSKEDFEDGKPSDSFFGWWSASAKLQLNPAEPSENPVIKCRGLDIYCMLEFANVAMKICAVIGLPMVLIVGPCHCFLGGYRAGKPGDDDADYMSYWGMANVVDGHPWLYWMHAAILWMVVVAVKEMIFSAMRAFLQKRRDWLMKMPNPRGTTVLVEGIPEMIDGQYRSDQALKTYFDKIFDKSGAVKEAVIVKYTASLLKAVKARDALQSEVHALKHKLQSGVADDTTQATLKDKEGELKDAEAQVAKERDEVAKKSKSADESEISSVNLSKAFVTFDSRRDAELAKMITYTPDQDEYVVSIPPDPSDILWADLQMDPMKEKIMSLIGYALIAGVFWAYLPTVISIAYFTSLETLAEYSAAFKSLADDPAMAALWDGLVNALALQLFLGFVPTFFVIIFSMFFCIKSGNALQHKIQEWYFYFQVIFVLLVTAVGSSLLDTLQELAEDPTSIVYLLASTLPTASHFYLNYLPLQWVTHAQNLLRFANLFKFLSFSKIFGKAAAIKKAEPEDQDYYGLGSRSARFTFMLVLTLNFASLSPMITMLGLINFWMCRKVYGYLTIFCETKKPDLGGFFYVSQLQHVLEGNFIYITLMTGVLLERDLTVWPGLIAASTYIYQYIIYKRFKTSFRWESLCFEDLMGIDTGKKGQDKRTSTGTYVQPEMIKA